MNLNVSSNYSNNILKNFGKKQNDEAEIKKTTCENPNCGIAHKTKNATLTAAMVLASLGTLSASCPTPSPQNEQDKIEMQNEINGVLSDVPAQVTMESLEVKKLDKPTKKVPYKVVIDNINDVEYITDYNEKGQILKISSSGKDKNNSSVSEYEYDNAGNYKIIDKHGDSIDRITEYNKDDEVIKLIDYTKRNKISGSYEYKTINNDMITIVRRGDGTLEKKLVNIDKNAEDGKSIKYVTNYADDGKTITGSAEMIYSEYTLKKIIEKRGDNTIARIVDYKDDRTETLYDKDGKTVLQELVYVRISSLAANMRLAKNTLSRNDGTLKQVNTYENGLDKEIHFDKDGKTVIYSRETEYKDKCKTKETHRRGDGTLIIVVDYSNGGKTKRCSTYKEDGKTLLQCVESEYDAAGNKTKITYIVKDGETLSGKDHNYTFDENGICTESALAIKLHNQLKGPSLNSRTIEILKQINPEKVIKVLSSYEKTFGKSLQEDLKVEWNLDTEKINNEYILKPLKERLKTLGMKIALHEIPERIPEAYSSEDSKYTYNDIQ